MAYDPAEQLAETEATLQASQTAYFDAATPTKTDLAGDSRRRSLERSIASADSKRLKARWYDDPKKAADTSGETTRRPVLEKFLGALTAPGKAVVGAAQYARDSIKGTQQDSFVQTVNKNIGQEGEMWGGFLRSLGAPGFIATPAGFALDIGADPLGWLTMGTSMFIPKVGYGLKKAGLKGASLAVKEQSKRSGYNILKHLSGISLKDEESMAKIATGAWSKTLPKGHVLREAFEQTATLGQRLQSSVFKMGNDALEAGAKFDEVTGRSLTDILAREGAAGPLGLTKRPSLQVEAYLRSKGFGAQVDAFKYSPQDWAKNMKLIDYQDRLDVLNGVDFGEIRTPDDLVRAEARLDQIAAMPLTKATPEKITDAARALDNTPVEAKPLVSQMSKLADEGSNVLQDIPYIRPETRAHMEEFIARSNMDRDSIELIRQSMVSARDLGKNKTGWKLYDDAYNKAASLFKIKYSNVPVGERVLDFLDLTHRVFALMKVPLSPSAWSNAIGGNLVMAHLSGINVLDPLFFKSMKGATDMSRGIVNEAFFAKMRPFVDSIEETTSRLRTYVHKTLGVDPRYMETMQQTLMMDEAVKLASKSGVTLTHEEVIQAMVEAKRAVPLTDRAAEAAKTAANRADKAEAAAEISKSARAAKRQAPLTASDLRQLHIEGKGDLPLSSLPADFATDELYGGAMAPLLAALKRKSETSAAAKFLHAAATKPGSWYGKIDSTYKLGTWHHLMVNGVTESELRILNRFLPLSDSITGTAKSGATLRYTISPEKALDAVNEIYMQYAAMPTAVNVLRSLPIIGSPFAAFPYAMVSKTAKALAYNPTAFNKVSYLLEELGGRKTPLEKQALDGPYYQHLKSPGFLRLEFFKDNPLYVNLTNMISYFSLSQLGPTERTFDSKWANVVAQAIDSSPFFKNPWGQTLIDTFVIPSFLDASETPQGYFGQKLWPTDATSAEKVGYTARNFGEAFTPNVIGLAGIIAAKYPALANEGVVEKIPNAKLRAMLNATQGKNQMGIQTQEAPGYKMLRTLSGLAGLPVTPVKTEFNKK